MFKYISDHKKQIVYKALLISWLIVFILTSLPGKYIPDLKINDKAEHCLAYAVLGSLLCLASRMQMRLTLLKKYSILFAMFVMAAYGFLDEQHQKLIPGRVCDMADWVADIAGAFAGILMVGAGVYLQKRIRRNSVNI